MADLYSVLGVQKNADAAAIKRAYRKLAKQHHPDKNKDDAVAAERFKQASAAYDILSDEKRRGEYDRGEIDEQGNPKFSGFGGRHPGNGNPWQGGATPGGFEFEGDPSDLFSELFGRASSRGGYRAPPRKGADVGYRLAVSLTDAALANQVRLTLANGKSINLKIPKGVEEGSKMRLVGQGEPGPAGPGDAIVEIHINNDQRFTRDGDDIRTDINVPLETAVLGGKQRVPTPEGEVMLKIAAGTSSGKVMRLKGRGWTKRDGTRGDLLARVMVEIPDDDPALAEFFRARAAQAA